MKNKKNELFSHTISKDLTLNECYQTSILTTGENKIKQNQTIGTP